jgi:hypothetical protein
LGLQSALSLVIPQFIGERHGFRGLAMKIATKGLKGHS